MRGKTAEEAVVFAGLSDDWDGVREMLKDFLPGELAEFQSVLTAIDNEIDTIRDDRAKGNS